ncbi:unnamed protein product [Prorocentrum cordatum]|uniref:Uncharacterized protein n=1 Tax=Prorocentrum cordatum TaxID=2364126 RepID=A0ABN9S0H5_9DINO|nr:unnamed protein product [Polarella glacialis]
MAPKGVGSKQKAARAAPKATAKKPPKPAPKKVAKPTQDDDESLPEVNPKSQDARMKAKTELDAKILEFQRQASNCKEQDPNLFKKIFTKSELSALWGRLKEARKKESMSVQEAWDTLCSLKVGANQKKNDILTEFLLGKPWQSRLITVVREHAKKETFENKQIPLSRGELQQKLGYEEAERKIAAGKFEEVEDSDGEILYIKKEKSFTQAASSATKVSDTRAATWNVITNAKKKRKRLSQHVSKFST